MSDIFSIRPKEPSKDTDQTRVFREIWDEREHKSEISQIPLAYNFQPSMFFVFSHVMSKGSCPKLLLDKDFIVLMTLREHQLWEFERQKLVDDNKWSWVFDLLEIAKGKCDG